MCVWSMILSICTHICVCACSPHVSECVSKVPHSFIMSSKCEEQKSRDKQNKTEERRDEVKVERKQQKQDVLIWISCFRHSVLIVFISYAYFGVVLLLFVWPP